MITTARGGSSRGSMPRARVPKGIPATWDTTSSDIPMGGVSVLIIKRMTLNDLAKTEEEHLRIIRYLDERSPEGEAFMISHIYYKKID